MSGEWCNADLREDLDDGRWVDTALVRRSSARVDTLVPHGFDAYARVLHPVRADDEFGRQRWLLRWADIARATGTIPHARMQLESLLAPVPEGFLRSGDAPAPEKPVEEWDSQLTSLAHVLSAHTTTPGDCWFTFWEGNTAFDAGIPPEVAKLQIDPYRYFVVRGPVARAADRLHGLQPHMWWPSDRSWFVATHFDFPCAYLGGTSACVDDVLASPGLDAWPATIDDPVTAESDPLNPWRR